MWCDEVIVLDKESSDSTREIARKFNCRIIVEKNTDAYNASEFHVFRDACQTEWAIQVTASDIIHPSLAYEILKLIRDPSFNFDIIEIPYQRQVFGVGGPESPWYSEYSCSVYRKGVMVVRDGRVHDPLSFSSQRVYRIKRDGVRFLYHLTHPTVASMMNRHLRYWQGEALDTSQIDLKQSFWLVVRRLISVVLKRRNIFKGETGKALSFAMLSYYMMAYVYKWEALREKKDPYVDLRAEVLGLWDEHNAERTSDSTFKREMT